MPDPVSPALRPRGDRLLLPGVRADAPPLPERYNFKRVVLPKAIEGGADGRVLGLGQQRLHRCVTEVAGTKLSRISKPSARLSILADGRLRDFAELEHYDLAIYCRGETTRWGGDTVTPYAANLPVVDRRGGGLSRRLRLRRRFRRRGHRAYDVRAVLHTANQVVAADAESIAIAIRR